MSTSETMEFPIKEFIESDSIEWQIMAPGVKRKILAYDKNLMMVRVEF